MTPVIQRRLAVCACLAVSLMLAGSTLSAAQPEAKQATVTSQSQAATESPQITEQGQKEMAKEMEGDPCPMTGSRMGMPWMGGMGRGMAMPKMAMRGARPWMGMPGMRMGMPMMRGRMMMYMVAHNPKLAGKMLEMRADMMRAIADVLTKYGQQMESGQWPAMETKPGPGK